MKSVKMKTYLQVLTLLSVGLLLGYKLFPRQFNGIGFRMLSTIKVGRAAECEGRATESEVTPTAEKSVSIFSGKTSAGDFMALKCRIGGPICLKKQKIKLMKMLNNRIANLHTKRSPEEWGRVLPPENSFFQYKPLEDHLKAGNGTTSSIDIVGKRNGYRQNDNLTVVMTVRDGYGEPTGHGGDQIRVWMVDDKRKASLATEVNDLGNGSYIAVLPLPWSGTVTVKASLIYNAAVQRAHYYVRYLLKSTRFLGAAFVSHFSNEITLCSPFRRIPGYSKVCNFTDQNGGMPWICGMPKDSALNCRHWRLNYDFDFVDPLPATAAEKWWWSVLKNRFAKNSLHPLGSHIKIIVDDGEKETTRNDKKMPCQNVPLRNSWHTKAPRGYFLNQRWFPARCSLDFLTKKMMNDCLRNTTILTLGDSNARKVLERLSTLTGCSVEDEKKREWHSPMVCNNDKTGIVIWWVSHALPFHVGSRDAADRTNQKAVHQFIDEIPKEGRFLVIVHVYIHFTAHRDNLFITHIKAIRESIESLLERNSRAKIAIRGLHAFYENWFTPNGGDLAGPFYTEYIKEAFRGLEDRVLFLQPWDMTVAMENRDIHPPGYVTNAIVDLILGHLCR